MHDDLRKVARHLLDETAPPRSGGTPQAAEWAALIRAGWFGLEVPEVLEGEGATLAEVGVVLREIGRVACLSPYLGSVVLGVGALVALAPHAERDGLLRRLATGQERVAVALPSGEGPGVPVFTLRGRGRGWSAGGAGKHGLVPDAAGAEGLLLPAAAPDGRPLLAYVHAQDPGLCVEVQALVDGSRRMARVTADALPVSEDALWRFGGDPDRSMAALQNRAAFALSCDGLGLAEAVLDITVQYVTSRHPDSSSAGRSARSKRSNTRAPTCSCRSGSARNWSPTLMRPF